MNDCIFCKIAAGQIPADRVYEDDEIVVFRDIYPKAAVHLLMIPRRHLDSLGSAEKTDDELLASLLRKAVTVARAAGLNDGFRTIINTGRGGGQEVMHLHLHILGGGALPGF